MNTFKIDENSLSFKFANYLSFPFNGMRHTSYFSNYPKDFCTYWRHVLLWSPLILLFFTVTAAAFAFCIGALLYGAFTEPGQFFVMLGVIVAFVVTVFGSIFILENTKQWTVPVISWLWNHGPRQVLSFIFVPIGNAFNWVFVKIGDGFLAMFPPKIVDYDSDGEVVEAQPSLWMQRYLALKGKYCPMIEYTNNEEVVN